MPFRGILYIENISLYIALSQILADDDIILVYISEYKMFLKLLISVLVQIIIVITVKCHMLYKLHLIHDNNSHPQT